MVTLSQWGPKLKTRIVHMNISINVGVTFKAARHSQ